MDYGKIAGNFLQGIGKSAEQNAQRGETQQRPMSPTSAFVQAARQANLERQQQAAMQMQTAPTAMAATPGGAMSNIGGGSALQLQGAPIQNAPGGLVTQGQPDPALLAAMAANRGF